IAAIYGDFAVSGPVSGTLAVRCTATRVPGRPVLAVEFEGAGLPDLVGAASSPYRFRRRPDYVELPGPYPGWRSLVAAGDSERLYLTASGKRALVNLDEAPPESVVDWIVCVAQSVQSGVLFLHAGTVGVRGAGALIIAPTNGG